jgi:outer membrane biosynthesis protein TonB
LLRLQQKKIKKKLLARKEAQDRALHHYLFRMVTGTADQLDDSFYSVFGSQEKDLEEQQQLLLKEKKEITKKEKKKEKKEKKKKEKKKPLVEEEEEEEIWWEQRRSKQERTDDETNKNIQGTTVLSTATNAFIFVV